MLLKYFLPKYVSLLKKSKICIVLLILILFSFSTKTAKASTTVTIDRTSSGGTSWQHTTGNNANTMLIVGVNAHTATGPVSSVSYDGVNLTRLSSVSYPASGVFGIQMWYLKNPHSGTHTVSISGSANLILGGAATFYNVDLVNTFGATANNNGVSFGGPTSVSVNATTSQLVVDTLGWSTQSTGVAPGGGQTLLWEQFFGGTPAMSSGGSSKTGTGGTTTMSWSGMPSGGVWAGIAAAINGVAAIPTPTFTPIPTSPPAPTPTFTPIPTVTFTPTPTPNSGSTYTITGNVFTDSNSNGVIDNGEQNYSGGISINATGGSVTTANATYSITGLSSGNNTVSYTNLPPGYYMTYPLNGTPASFMVTVGPGCNTNGANDATCTNGNISNLNFGITKAVSWVQAACGDIRVDSGFTDPIPASASCNGTSGPYANLSNATCSTPGIVFSGNAAPDFGQGQASAAPYNWTAGNTITAEKFKPTMPTVIKTSYEYVSTHALQSGITPTDLSTKCSLNSCTLTALPHGLYQTDPNAVTDLHVKTSNLSGNQNYVFLINGDLYIDGPITIAQGSTATFSVAGNIYVNSTVGNASATDTTADIEGLYSTDKSFIVNTTGTCPDLRLNISGSVVVNAVLQGGSFQNNRNLCDSNASCPTVSFTQRPDLLLNAAELIKYNNHVWKEITPGN